MYPSIEKYCCPQMEEACTKFRNICFDWNVPNNLTPQALLHHHTYTTKSPIALRYCPFCGEKIEW